MSKMTYLFSSVVATLLTVSVHGGVELETSVHTNSIGQPVYTLAAVSDIGPIHILEIDIRSDDGSLQQYHPAGVLTYLNDFNRFFGEIPADHDTQAMFGREDDDLLVIDINVDSNYQLKTGFSHFEPFNRRDIVQIVLPDPNVDCMCEIKAWVDREVHTITQPCVPEPMSLSMLLLGGMTLLRRLR